MKVTTHDLLAILRRFDVASDDNLPKQIDQVKSSNPSPINQLIRFRFNKTYYFVLIDETAEDKEAYIMDQIYTAKSDAEGVIIENPTSDFSTYGLPFKGRDVYLFALVRTKRRLDVVLAERFPDISRSAWQKYIKQGFVAVNSIPAKSSRQEVSEADSLEINIPEATDYSDEAFPILYIDDNVIVINKPAGVLTHSKGMLNDEFTVADFFRRYTTVGLDTNRPGIVHRLDRDTSGVIIGARTPESAERLKRQFSERLAKKRYIAITEGIPQLDRARIDVPIGRNPSSPSTFRPDAKGKSAVTDYVILESVGKRSLIELLPKTGRTHQLRVHLKHLNTPILGDRVYGKSADRLYLHAYQLEVTIAPDQRRTFTAPLPSEFDKVMPHASTSVSRLS